MGAGPSRRRRSGDASMYTSPPPPPPPSHSQMYSVPPPGPNWYGPYAQSTRYPVRAPQQAEYNGAMVHYYPPGSYSDGRHRYAPPNSNYLPQPSSNAPPNGNHAALTVRDESSSSAQQQSGTVTIRNLVNIQKGTIRFEQDEENPGFYLLAFSYDADFAGSISIFIFAKEGDNCSVKPLNRNFFKPVQVPFEKGYGQKFKQASGTGVYLNAFEDIDLEKEGPDEVCPLVIRAQTAAKDSPPEDNEGDEIGGPLPKSVNAQMTQAVIERKGPDNCKVRVLRQVIWVDGVRYELKELYGIESAVDGNGYDEDDLGKECVICMSEPRDTAVLPCRHLCMCSGCAKEFKSQMNRCPICRQIVDSLLKIK